jgi:uncharacterized protein YecT (DUF1311 family)
MPRTHREKSNSSFNLPVVRSFISAALLFGFCSANNLEAAIFARDSVTDLTIDPPGSAGASGIFSFAHFANSTTDEDFDFGGGLKLDGNLYRLDEQPDQKNDAKVVIEGDLEGEQLEVKTSGLTDSRKKSYELSGTYRKLSNQELHERARRRYDQADAWLNAIYGRAKAKLAASSFADLKKREANWIDYRDSFAEQSAGINAIAESLPEEVARLQSLRDLTMFRIKFIRSLLDDSLPTGISGVYHDEYGGQLDLEKDRKGVKFRLSVVRGPTGRIDPAGITQRKTRRPGAAYRAPARKKPV